MKSHPNVTIPLSSDFRGVTLDMCNNRETVDQDDLAKEHDLLASLIEKLKCEIDDSKNRNKFLETSNKALVDKLKDLKKFQVELDRYYDVNYASKVAIDCVKAKRDLMSYKMESEKSFNEYTPKINDLNQTLSEMKKELFAHQETISIMSKEKEAQKKFHKTLEDKELEKVIALENKIKVLDDIVYKTGQSVQTMNMLNHNCKTSFVKPEFLKKAQRVNPRLYDIGCYNGNLSLMLAPKSDETIRFAQESRSKLSDLMRPFDYKNLNNLYDLSVPQREKSSEHRYFSKRSKMSHTPVKNENSKESFNKHTTLLEKRMDESILWDQKCKSSKELFKIKSSVDMIFDRVMEWNVANYSIVQWNHIFAHRDNSIHHRLLGAQSHNDGKSQASKSVAFWKSTCYIRDLKGNDLLTGSHGTYLYFITLQDTSTTNPICLMAKASSSQAWLWHRRLSHLNFDSINLLSKNDIVIGLLKLKFVKDHLYSSCELGKAKRKSFHTKTTPSSKRRLQLLHMDLCGPMRIEHEVLFLGSDHGQEAATIVENLASIGISHLDGTLDDFRELEAHFSERTTDERLQHQHQGALEDLCSTELERRRILLTTPTHFIGDGVQHLTDGVKPLRNVPVPLDHFPVNALTSKVFSFMVKKGKHFSGKVTPLFASMLVQLTEDEGATSDRPSEPQPTPSPPHPSEANVEPQSDPSPIPSPTTNIPDSIPEASGGNHGGQSSSDRSLSGNEGDLILQSVYDLCISLCLQVTAQAKQIKHLNAKIKKLKKQAKHVIAHHKAWVKSVSLKERLAAKKSLKKQWMQKESVSKQGRKPAKTEPSVHKDPAFDELADDIVDYIESENAQDVGRTRSRVSEEKETIGNGVSIEDAVSTDEEKVSTDRPNVSTDRPRVSTDKEEVSTDRPDEVLLNMSQAKAVSREKEKGVELKDVVETGRPRPTSTRSLLTLKPLPKIDPKDKGKKKIKEEDESDSESEGEEERKRLAEEEATNDALIRNYDDIKARIEAGNFKHSNLKTKKFEKIQALYEKIKRSDEDFIAIGSVEDERMIKEMNEKGIDSSKDDSVKEEVKEEKGTKKRKSGHIKMIARKKPRPLKDVDSDEEHRKCLKIVTFEGTIDSEIMETKSFISRLDKVSSPEGDYLVVYRVNGNFRAFNYLIEVLHIFDRQDLFHLYDLMMEQYSEITQEGIELILWGDLKIMMESLTEGNDQSDFWDDQQDWEIIT
ncbi:retrovirus-related pol polyprotein from transposon TNT 1-94 [Tanacetum coccineum]